MSLGGRGRGRGSLLERTRAQREGRTTGPEEDESAMSEALNPEFAGTNASAMTRADPNTETEDNMSETSTGETIRGKGKSGKPLVWKPRKDRPKEPPPQDPILFIKAPIVGFRGLSS